MKKVLSLLLFAWLMAGVVYAQNKIENVIIITTDGLRWQEVFKGMEAELANNSRFNQEDSAGIYKKYWAATPAERRSKLMPFLWNTINRQGQIYGNRDAGAKVNVANPYWFSFPGYSEIFCGFVDTAVNTNAYKNNPNTNVLEFLNKQDRCETRVAVFGAWSALDDVLNEKRSKLPIVCGHEPCGGDKPDAEQQLMNAMKRDAHNPINQWETLDVFTHYAAMDHLKKKQPRVLYVSYGETDAWAHQGHYKDYLDAAHTVDKWIAEIWDYMQRTKQYKDKTMLLFTVDHGRGDGDKWTDHDNKIPGSDNTWFAVMGPGMPAKGEVKQDVQLYQQQFAQTIAQMLGYTFTCEHKVANGLAEVLKK